MDRIPSANSTGGTGTFFEQHVNAYWLAQLLVQGIPPILINCSVVEVHMQTDHLGWHTDDFLIIVQNSDGNYCKMAGQVKLTFTISAVNSECKKTISDFWRDFGNNSLFSPKNDRLVLVTQRGTNTLLKDFVGLLDCARAARDGNEFKHRLMKQGFISKKAFRFCEEICKIIGEIENKKFTTETIWSFLRVLYVLSLDLLTSTNQTEAQIKTLLAHTATDSDKTGSANTSWNNLLTIAADAMTKARSFKRIDFPDFLLKRYSVCGGIEQKALLALKNHSELILRGIRSTIGKVFHLPRTGLVQQLLEQIESTQVVLVTGHAGSGKSVVAKDTLALLSSDYFTFCFRAEEFAQPHLDAMLQNSQIPMDAITWGAILAAQDRKVLLIESVERLLEKSTRDAFSDLLSLVASDKSFRLILTCRDYSADQVRTSFLTVVDLDYSDILIPQFDDTELMEVEKSIPQLARPLKNPALRQVMRTPYFSDKALQISWLADRPLPISEREFRLIFWQQVVRADNQLLMGTPRLREMVFEEIAVRRARALDAYITYNDLDISIIDSLQRDSLIVSSDQSSALVAPAHDVLEDWAILQWIEEKYHTCGNSFQVLSEVIGTHPAIRRAYRKWVAELIERDPDTANQLFNAAVSQTKILAQFRDDTIVSLLRAPLSLTFFERHTAELLANNKDLLKRVIHLLRVACVTSPSWLPVTRTLNSLFNVPDGPSWVLILRIVQDHIEEFSAPDQLLLLGLIEDWVRGVSWKTPYPDGANSVASIAHHLLPHFDRYRSEETSLRILKVIAKIPKADVEGFEILLKSDKEKDRHYLVETFHKIIFSELDGTAAARDLPVLIIAVASDYLLCSESELQQIRELSDPFEIETLFGVKSRLRLDFFPPSAFRGPWLPLLRYHPHEGTYFIIKVFNHSADWYAHPRVKDHVEPPFEIEINFSDETSRKQWGNERLWNWYRGTSVGPSVLQSLLMAFERWLLEFAETHPEELDAVFIDILHRSDSVALTAVVASVATAFPHLSAETLLTFLRSPKLLILDRSRFASEMHGTMSGFVMEDDFYREERKKEDARPHHKSDLEAAILNLQLGPLAARVHELIDQNRSSLPPTSEQSDDDRLWRLSMHRMDIRQYTIADANPTSVVSETIDATPKSKPSHIQLNLNKPDPDIKIMVDENLANFNTMSARLGLFTWARQVFKNEDAGTYDPAKWQQQLSNARTLVNIDNVDKRLDIARGGPEIVAAVCIRDHWEEMSSSEQDWCIDKVCSEVIRDANVWDDFARRQRYEISADRLCAYIISVLICKPLSEIQRLRIQDTFVAALTHSNDEVRWYAAWGIAKQIGTINYELSIRCVNALAMEAILVAQAYDKEHERPYSKRRKFNELMAEKASIVRQQFWEEGGIEKDACQRLDTSKWFGAEANGRILVILGQIPSEPLAISTFTRASQTLVKWWNSDEIQRNDRKDKRIERNHETELAISKLIQNFVMKSSEDAAKTILIPILDAVDRHPDKLSWLIRGLIVVEDCSPNTKQFWFLWSLFADCVKTAQWLTQMNSEYPKGREMISILFLGTEWKKEIRHWKSLEGHAHHIHSLFEDLPLSSTVIDGYVRFLYHIGEKSLPDAFVRIINRLLHGDIPKLLKNANTVFYLETLLQRYVYGRPLELKNNPVVRDAVLQILDGLVEIGSSAAFRMRDDFVTPAISTLL